MTQSLFGEYDGGSKMRSILGILGLIWFCVFYIGLMIDLDSFLSVKPRFEEFILFIGFHVGVIVTLLCLWVGYEGKSVQE